MTYEYAMHETKTDVSKFDESAVDESKTESRTWVRVMHYAVGIRLTKLLLQNMLLKSYVKSSLSLLI